MTNILPPPLTKLLKCPQCGTRYNRENIRFIQPNAKTSQSKQQPVQLHSQCINCNSSIILTVFFGNGHVITTGVSTDLTPEDAAILSTKNIISVDDIINIHKSLKGVPTKIQHTPRHHSKHTPRLQTSL